MFFFFFLVNELELSIGPPPKKKTNIQIKIKGSTGLSVFFITAKYLIFTHYEWHVFYSPKAKLNETQKFRQRIVLNIF